MTSEVALMNRSAVALAADSATTVEYWTEGQRKVRYFKGANKIFNLSNVHPVGLMTFGSANLQGVPWEVIVKSFRDIRGSTSKDTLADYAADFFQYIGGSKYIFPKERQESSLIHGIGETAANIGKFILLHDKVKSEEDPGKRKAV